jgi:regulator of sigma E protease
MPEALTGGLWSFAAIIFVFGLIVLVHEWGHMVAAKLCGVAVPDFALGMGPSLVSRFYRGTRYHICAFPIGGFVQIAGLSDDPLNRSRSEAELHPQFTDGGRLTKRWQDITGWQKAFILVAGVAMNFVLAFVLMIVQGCFVGFPNNHIAIGGVEPGMPAAEAGLRPGDIVQSVDGKELTDLTSFSQIVGQHAGTPVQLSVLRSGEPLQLSAVPRSRAEYNDGRPSLGVQLQYVSEWSNRISAVMLHSAASAAGIKRGERVVAVNGQAVDDGLPVMLALPGIDAQLRAIDADGELIPKGGGTPIIFGLESPKGARREVTVPGDTTIAILGLQFTTRLERVPPAQAIQRSLKEGVEMMATLLGGMKLLFTKAGAESVSGPIGIFSILGQTAQSDLYTFMMWVILINLNLAVMNLLPLPALDGGRLVFVGLAGVGLRVPEKREALIHAAGMVLVLCFMVLISIRDLGGLWRGWTTKVNVEQPVKGEGFQTLPAK